MTSGRALKLPRRTTRTGLPWQSVTCQPLVLMRARGRKSREKRPPLMGAGGDEGTNVTIGQAEYGCGAHDDLPLAQNRGLRGRSFSGNGQASAGAFHYMRAANDLESEIHQVEQDAYTGVLRAFKVQSDAISWEKESLITELRKELRVSDEEHRELLNKVNEDGAIRQMRELRQAGGTPSAQHRGSRALYDAEPGPTAKRQRTSHPIPSQSVAPQSPVMPSHSVPSAKWGPLSARGKKAKTPVPLAQPSADPSSLINHKVYTRWPEDNNFYEATITRYNSVTGEHTLVYDIGTQAETWEMVRLCDMPPEDIRLEFDGHLLNRDGWGPSGPMLKRHPGNNGAMAGQIRGRGRLSINEPIKDYTPPQNGINGNFDNIDIPNTESVVTEVERVLSNPNMHEIEKARKLLKDHEQSLLDAIARVDEASDSESEDMAAEGRMGPAGDGNGITT
ncbi:Protein EMSY-LIKE 3 [Dichanthelium oligosanthes]|uniref:Protein EMSY-LIKE 3 n=1 Tax=Dichanthelium oligosanthes TaxID=888268 RepID=A0A1E5UW12_9POAL|nr:Protein EMSY-LIKE 3 [Dichanthelium oligosanthes]